MLSWTKLHVLQCPYLYCTHQYFWCCILSFYHVLSMLYHVKLKILCKFEKWWKFSRHVKAKACKTRPACILFSRPDNPNWHCHFHLCGTRLALHVRVPYKHVSTALSVPYIRAAWSLCFAPSPIHSLSCLQ